jgi:hypothetical protein
MPSDDPALREDEEPLADDDSLELTLVSAVEPEETAAQSEDATAESGAETVARDEDAASAAEDREDEADPESEKDRDQ